MLQNRNKKSILLLTDFSYQAKGREYFREDMELSSFLQRYFHVATSHISSAGRFLTAADLVLIRNTGPQVSHQKNLADLMQNKNLLLFNDLLGNGDLRGKNHLLELYKAGFPVIPTFSSKEDFWERESSEYCLLKPLDGADSCGVRILPSEELVKEECQHVLIQPLVDFEYEISFYFIGKHFHYSLYAPNVQKRWELKPYAASLEDIVFASKFVEWNACERGIQRVDACRLRNGELLLMELEDYNPFLSLDALQRDAKEQFLEALCSSLEKCMR